MTEHEIDYSLHYRKWHNTSIEHYNSYVPFYAKMLTPHIGEGKDLPILDIGCGMGLALYALKQKGYKNLKGVDISKQQVNAAVEKGLDVELLEDTNTWLRGKANTFERVLALDVIEHIPVNQQIEVAKGIAHSLKTGGKFICTVPNANSVLASRWRYIDWTHSSSFTEHSLEFLLLNSGFSEVKIYETEFFNRPNYPFVIRKSVLQWLFFKIMRWFRRQAVVAELGPEGKTIPLSLNLLAVAKK
jgi:predicted TPR repeat methyltransferase